MDISDRHFELLCTLTLELTRLQQAECRHLAIENSAPDVLRGLLKAYIFADFVTEGSP